LTPAVGDHHFLSYVHIFVLAEDSTAQAQWPKLSIGCH
jgi:hypothetical protein